MTQSVPQPDEVVGQIEAAVDELGAPGSSATTPLPELAEQLAALHAGLQSALTELDRA